MAAALAGSAWRGRANLAIAGCAVAIVGHRALIPAVDEMVAGLLLVKLVLPVSVTAGFVVTPPEV